MPTFRRLLGFLRPHRRELWGSLIFAWAAMGMTVLIPWLIGEAVNAIENGNKPGLLPVVLAILGAAILRLGLTMVRRVVAGKVSLAVEFDLRQQIYGHLMRLELGFFDTQQTGQLMSRATVDLGAIRFFLGYGLIFFSQSLLTVLLAGTVMFFINPWLIVLVVCPLFVGFKHSWHLVFHICVFPIVPCNVSGLNDMVCLIHIHPVCVTWSVLSISNHDSSSCSVLPIPLHDSFLCHITNPSKLDQVVV